MATYRIVETRVIYVDAICYKDNTESRKAVERFYTNDDIVLEQKHIQKVEIAKTNHNNANYVIRGDKDICQTSQEFYRS